MCETNIIRRYEWKRPFQTGNAAFNPRNEIISWWYAQVEEEGGELSKVGEMLMQNDFFATQLTQLISSVFLRQLSGWIFHVQLAKDLTRHGQGRLPELEAQVVVDPEMGLCPKNTCSSWENDNNQLDLGVDYHETNLMMISQKQIVGLLSQTERKTAMRRQLENIHHSWRGKHHPPQP